MSLYSYLEKSPYCLINLFHGGFLIVVIAIERRQVFHIIIDCIIVLFDRQTQLDETVDARSKRSGFI